MHGMCGTLDAELEVQRTIQRAELTGLHVSHLENYRSHHGSCRRQNHRRTVERRNEMLWSKSKGRRLGILLWDEVCRVRMEGTLLKVEHVKAHRSKKEKQQISLFEKFCHGERDMKKETSLQKMEQCWMEERWFRSGPAQSNRKQEIYEALQYAFSFPLSGGRMARL